MGVLNWIVSIQLKLKKSIEGNEARPQGVRVVEGEGRAQ